MSLQKTASSRSLNVFGAEHVFRRLTRNAGQLFLSHTFSGLLGFLQSALIARALGVEEYGVFVLTLTYVTAVGQLISFRVWELAVRYTIQFTKKAEVESAAALVKLCYLIDLCSGVATLLIAVVAARFVQIAPSVDTTGLILIFAFSLIVSGLDGTSTAILRVYDEYSWIAHATAVSSIFLTASVVIVAPIFPSLLPLAFCHLIGTVVRAIALNTKALSALRKSLGPKWWIANLGNLRRHRREMARFLLSSNLNGTMKLLQTSLDVLLIGFWKGPIVVGYYNIGKVLTGLLGRITTPLYESIYPELSRLWENGYRTECQQLVRRTATLTGVISVTVVLMTLWFGVDLISITYGNDFLSASIPLMILMIGSAIALTSFWGHPFLVAMGRPWLSSLAFGLSVGTQVVALFALIPAYGAIGASVAFVLFYVVWTSLVIVFIRHEYRSVSS